MKKLITAVSASLWLAAFGLTSAPADAQTLRIPQPLSYFSCSQYSSINMYTCYATGSNNPISFVGKHFLAPASNCASGCTGTIWGDVTNQVTHGRKQATTSGQCNGQYLTNVVFCANCG